MMGKENLTDIGIGGGALTVPLWVHQLEAWAQVIVIFGSAILVVYRVGLMLRGIQRKPEGEG